MLNADHIAIIGGGFSGTLLAINLLHHGGPGATLVERRPMQLARGIAYGTKHREHLLNVRSANMSAFPDEPDHFVSWLEKKAVRHDRGFVGRSIYGAYLAEILAEAVARAPERLRILQDEAVSVIAEGALMRIALKSGEDIHADGVVLALGNLPPHDLPPLSHLARSGQFYYPDPWAKDIAMGLNANDSVLLIGTGLTAVDVALSLDSRGFDGKVVALSRRGLSPRAHLPGGAPPPARVDRPPASGSRLVAHVRARADAIGWRDAVDELRPHTQNIWRSASAEEQRRFLRHLRPFWDVHRHRLAPGVAERIEAMRSSGKLEFVAGRIEDAEASGDHVRVRWRNRGSGSLSTLDVQRIVNCTGPQGDLTRTAEPLLQALVREGLIRPDRLHLGIEVDSRGRAVGRAGEPNERLFAIGPMTRGAFWEIVAVPDLRHQSWDLARWLSAAHWVGGEGL